MNHDGHDDHDQKRETVVPFVSSWFRLS